MSNPKNHRPRKRFGQNFLCDSHIIQNIIHHLAIQPEDKIIEIGPGLGALTIPLLQQVQHLDVIEIDRDLVKKLQENLKTPEALTIYTSDVLKFDFLQLSKQYSPNTKFRIIGNLPYNISTPLLFYLIQFIPCIQDMIFMLQKEVVARLYGQPNHKDYGRLSIMMQYYFRIQPLFLVPPSAFHPRPKVQSQIVKLIPHEHNPYGIVDISILQNITRSAFNQRRKTLANALRAYLDETEFHRININPKLRPEALSIEEFVKISHYLKQRGYVNKEQS